MRRTKGILPNGHVPRDESGRNGQLLHEEPERCGPEQNRKRERRRAIRYRSNSMKPTSQIGTLSRIHHTTTGFLRAFRDEDAAKRPMSEQGVHQGCATTGMESCELLPDGAACKRTCKALGQLTPSIVAWARQPPVGQQIIREAAQRHSYAPHDIRTTAVPSKAMRRSYAVVTPLAGSSTSELTPRLRGSFGIASLLRLVRFGQTARSPRSLLFPSARRALRLDRSQEKKGLRDQ